MHSAPQLSPSGDSFPLGNPIFFCRLTGRRLIFITSLRFCQACNDFLRRIHFPCCKLWNIITLLMPAYLPATTPSALHCPDRDGPRATPHCPATIPLAGGGDRSSTLCRTARTYRLRRHLLPLLMPGDPLLPHQPARAAVPARTGGNPILTPPVLAGITALYFLRLARCAGRPEALSPFYISGQCTAGRTPETMAMIYYYIILRPTLRGV